MKRFLLISLVFVLTACVSAPTKAPTTDVPAGAPTVEAQATATTAPTDEPSTGDSATETPTSEVKATDDVPAGQNTFGDLEFKNKATGVAFSGTGGFSVNAFAYDCDSLPNTIAFILTVDNPDIYKVNYLFRMTPVDSPLSSLGWSADAKMKALGSGKFSLDFPATLVPAKSRTWKAWLDLQFIAFDNKDVTYSSPQINRLITYTYKCP